MTLYTKSILKEPSLDDGLRISVMRRHTLNDGITPDMRIDGSKYQKWMPILAPPEVLLGNYYKRGLPWEEFEKEYLNYIGSLFVHEQLRAIGRGALKSDITILCIEDTPDRCHRRLLAEECQKYEPSLKVIHK